MLYKWAVNYNFLEKEIECVVRKFENFRDWNVPTYNFSITNYHSTTI